MPLKAHHSWLQVLPHPSSSWHLAMCSLATVFPQAPQILQVNLSSVSLSPFPEPHPHPTPEITHGLTFLRWLFTYRQLVLLWRQLCIKIAISPPQLVLLPLFSSFNFNIFHVLLIYCPMEYKSLEGAVKGLCLICSSILREGLNV